MAPPPETQGLPAAHVPTLGQWPSQFCKPLLFVRVFPNSLLTAENPTSGTWFTHTADTYQMNTELPCS